MPLSKRSSSSWCHEPTCKSDHCRVPFGWLESGYGTDQVPTLLRLSHLNYPLVQVLACRLPKVGGSESCDTRCESQSLWHAFKGGIYLHVDGGLFAAHEVNQLISCLWTQSIHHLWAHWVLSLSAGQKRFPHSVSKACPSSSCRTFLFS